MGSPFQACDHAAKKDRKQISRTMIESTLLSSRQGEAVDVDPPKNHAEHQKAPSAVTTPESTGCGCEEDLAIPLSNCQPPQNARTTNNSALVSLSNVQPRNPSYRHISPQLQPLSTVLETPEMSNRLQSSPRVPTSARMQRQLHQPTNTFELRSPTSIYSEDTDDPFVTHDSPQDSLSAKSADDDGLQFPPKGFLLPMSPPWTVLNDPRAQEFSFMQNTRNGWTADLDQFIYSKRNLGHAIPYRTVAQYGTVIDYANIPSTQSQIHNQRTSVEREFAAVGHDRVHAAIEKQQQDTAHAQDKSLPSPPIESFSPEIRARLGLTGSNHRRPHHQRSGTAPDVLRAQFTSGQDVPQPLRLSPKSDDQMATSQHTTDASQNRFYRSPTVYSLNATQPRELPPPQRSPSRLNRLRLRLGRSPERGTERSSRNRSPEYQYLRSESSSTRASPERMYLRPREPSEESSPERRGRARNLETSPTAKVRDTSHRDLSRRLPHGGADTSRSAWSETKRSPERSTTLPIFPASSLPRASMDKLWGEKGVLSRPVPIQQRSGGQKGRKTPLKDMASRLFKVKESPYNEGRTMAGSPESKRHEPDGQSKFPISIDRGDQMRLFGEVEYMLQTLANDFLLEQVDGGRLSKKSVKEAVDKWARKGRAQVVDFCFDLRGQLELVQQNLGSVQFHGQDALDTRRRFVLVYAWKDVARELAVRSFCSGDSAVKKMLSDCYVILDMLGAEGAYWLIFQKLHVTTLDKIRIADDERKNSKELKAGQTRQVVPGSPIEINDGEEGVRTNRHLFETFDRSAAYEGYKQAE